MKYELIKIHNLKNIVAKNWLLCFAFILLLSCDDKIEELEQMNTGPTFQYFNRNSLQWNFIEEGIIIDSAKVHNEYNNAIYPIVLKINDSQFNTETIKIKTSDTEEGFFIDDTYRLAFPEDDVIVPVDSFSLGFRNSSAETHLYTIQASDYFGKENKFMLEISYKDNKLPVPKLSISLNNNIAQNEYELNASQSYDRDEKIGGFIVEYEFLINNIIIKTSQNTINHVFSPGTYTLKLRVKDNDNEWSNYITRNLTIE